MLIKTKTESTEERKGLSKLGSMCGCDCWTQPMLLPDLSDTTHPSAICSMEGLTVCLSHRHHCLGSLMGRTIHHGEGFHHTHRNWSGSSKARPHWTPEVLDPSYTAEHGWGWSILLQDIRCGFLMAAGRVKVWESRNEGKLTPHEGTLSNERQATIRRDR